ncbi:MAG: TVP38/TMEM64 family protein [Anaerolineales bacterium]|nr:TVP38/TMEM64 family protein [Anaerolineales bacterium]
MKTRNILFTATFLTILFLYRQPISDLLRIIGDQEAVSAYLQGFGAWGPLVLFILMVAQVFVAVIPGHALMVTAGYAYGVTGLLVIIASTVLGSQVAFFIARRYGRNLIYKLASPRVIQRWDGMARDQGVLFYFFAFVLPIFPSDLMCYVAGLGVISARRFLLANALGRSVVAISITLIGMYGLNPPLWFWLAAMGGMAALFAGWFTFKRRKGSNIYAE